MAVVPLLAYAASKSLSLASLPAGMVRLLSFTSFPENDHWVLEIPDEKLREAIFEAKKRRPEAPGISKALSHGS